MEMAGKVSKHISWYHVLYDVIMLNSILLMHAKVSFLIFLHTLQCMTVPHSLEHILKLVFIHHLAIR